MGKKNRNFYLVFISVFLLLGNLLAEAQTGKTFPESWYQRSEMNL